MDTFEWINDSGIAHVDFKTEKRTPKLSVSDRLESAFGPAAITARERTIIKGVIQMNCFRPGTGESRDRGPCTGCDSRSRGHLVGKGKVDRLRQQRSSSRLTSHFQFTARSRLRVHFRNRCQEGRLAWGHSLSTVASTNEPFAWAISADNKSVVGADTDGYFQMTVMSPGRIEMYHSHNGKAYQVNRRDMLYDGTGEKVGRNRKT